MNGVVFQISDMMMTKRLVPCWANQLRSVLIPGTQREPVVDVPRVDVERVEPRERRDHGDDPVGHQDRRAEQPAELLDRAVHDEREREPEEQLDHHGDDRDEHA